MSKFKFAILDDYQGISGPHFTHLEDRVEISHFPETLDPRIPEQQHELIQRLRPFDIILAMRERTPFSKEILSQLPNLKLVLTTGQRNRSLDTEYLASREIPVAGTESRQTGGNGKRKGTPSTVQHTWALILSLARHVARDDAAVKSGGWQGSLGMTLSGKTLGLVGLGKLGSAVARIAILGFGMDVIAWSANLTQGRADEAALSIGLEKGDIRAVPADEKERLFSEADVVSVHYVLSERSKGIVGAEELNAMKKDALLINTSRGPLVDEEALLEVLNKGGIGGAALDVFDPEPLPPDSPWRTTEWGLDGRSEVILTPHMGYGDEQIHGWYDAPTHPDLIHVHHAPGSFASGAYSLVSLPAGSLFTTITGTTPAKKAYTSVQTGRNSHIELNSDLVYCNHSCEPSLIFDMGKMEVRVVDHRPLEKGDALTFFYPSSEWDMDQKFGCTCGSGSKCKGRIGGAKDMERSDLNGYWLNGHIEELLRERDGL
ncbi:D-isomer specific 2-hydroxyacid dehydrogenase [Aspergillus undulatus]|uniref:D-isomer specific 2-hydroxyacid dehydrogenase n=1 Tax=Aspergillus undulatus TaxID=1810928 RepID=UPI003CCE0348